jgi:hypothetical protein
VLKNTKNTKHVAESKYKRHKEIQYLFLKFGQPQRLPTSSLMSSQSAGSLSTLILPKLPPMPTRFLLSIPMKRRAIQTSRDFTTILGSSRTTPSHLGDGIPKNNKLKEVIEGEGEVLLLEGGTLKGAQIFSQEQESRLES